MNAGKKLRSSTFKLQEDETYYTGSNISYSDDDDSSEYQSDAKNIKSNRGRGGNGHKIERKPTRVPNLKIQNRNALLARENRKRKKELMENLEKDVDILHDKNKRLQKVIKTQDSQMKKLNKEINYLKSVLKNHTEIVQILKSISHAPRNTNKEMESVLINSPKSSSDTLSCNSSDDDLEAENIVTDWNDILKNPLSSVTDFSDLSSMDQTSGSSPFSEISTDHNYSHYQTNPFEELSTPGICLHINTGRVSLEYCSVCHHNASNSWENTN